MKRKIFNVLFALVLVLTFSLVAAVPVAADPATYYAATDGSDEFGDGTEVWVDNDSSGNWTAGDTGPWLTIQYSIDSASAGDTIMVAAGTYNESYIDIDKSLTLQGAGDDETYIDVGYSYGIRVNLGWDGEDELAETVVIDGFYMDDIEDINYFIWLEEVNNGSSATVSNCILDSYSGGDGIYCGEDTLDNGSTVTIEGNEIYYASYGLYFEEVMGGSALNIVDNLIYENGYGIRIEEVSGDSTVTMTGNTVGAYEDEVIELGGNLYTGVYFNYVYDSTVTIGGTGEGDANIIGYNGRDGYGDGIYFYETDNATTITIQGNIIGYYEDGYWTGANNGCGINFGWTTITDSTILIGGETREAGNIINGNSNYGIYLALAGSNVTIMNNDIISNNDYGIYTYISENSSVDIHYNNIVNNDGGVYNEDLYAVDAENNWWGSASGPSSEDNTFNVGEQGNGAYELVDFCPWLDAAVPDGESFAPVTSEDGFFSSIGAAIDAVTGTTITCAAGTYTENPYIDQSLTLQGAGAENTTIDGWVGIELGWGSATPVAETVVFDGFSLYEGEDLIDIYEVNNGSNLTISNCILANCWAGIYSYDETTDNVSTVTIEGNEIYYADYSGIYFQLLTGGSALNIIDNTVYDNDYEGIYISEVSENSTVTMTGNTVGGWYDVEEDTGYSGNDYAGIVIGSVYDSAVTIGGDTEAEANFISNNGWNDGGDSAGICIYYTDNNTTLNIQGNIIGAYETAEFEYYGNYQYGIYLGGDGGLIDSTATIEDNTINENSGDGIYAEYLEDTSLEILNNDIMDNGWTYSEGEGIYIWAVDEDSSVDIHYNSIVNNYNYGLYYDGNTYVTADARYNWWGDVAGPYDDYSPDNYINPYNDYTDGDYVTGDVDYIPWMIQSELAEDWNIWSRPIVPDEDSRAQMQAELEAAGVDTIYYFNSDTQLWGTDPDDSGLLDAWYIKAPDATRIRYYFSDEATMPSQKAMKVGWNFVGLAELYEMDAPDALLDAYYGTGVAGDLVGYSKAISPSLNGVSWTYLRGTDGFAAYMYPTRGYWVFMVNNGTLGGFTSTPIVEEYD